MQKKVDLLDNGNFICQKNTNGLKKSDYKQSNFRKKEIILSKTKEVLNKLKEISQSGLSATAINFIYKR